MGSGTITLNISLPQALREYVEQQARDGGYSSPSEYVKALCIKIKSATGARMLKLYSSKGSRQETSSRLLPITGTESVAG